MNASIISTWLLLLATAAHIQNVNGAHSRAYYSRLRSRRLLELRSWTPLMKAVKANNINLVTHLLANNTDAKATNNDGYTALMFAAMYGNEKSVELLIPHSDVKATNDNGWTALMLAAFYGNEKSVELLIPHSDVKAINNDGATALDIAETRGYNHIVSLLQ